MRGSLVFFKLIIVAAEIVPNGFFVGPFFDLLAIARRLYAPRGGAANCAARLLGQVLIILIVVIVVLVVVILVGL